MLLQIALCVLFSWFSLNGTENIIHSNVENIQQGGVASLFRLINQHCLNQLIV